MRISCVQYTAEPDLAESESRLYPLLDQAVQGALRLSCYQSVPCSSRQHRNNRDLTRFQLTPQK